MRIKSAGIILLILFLCSTGYGFDREQIHQNRLKTGQRVVNNNIQLKGQSVAKSLNDAEIIISTSSAGATFDQENVSLTELSDGNFLVVFEDNRNGATKIFMQVYDDTTKPVGINTLMFGSDVGDDFVECQVKTDSQGRVYVFYRDLNNGLIFGGRLNPDLSENIAPFVINDNLESSYAGPYDFDIYPDGKVVVVWEEYSVLGSTIAYRLYDTSFTSSFGPATVNSDGGGSSHWVPSVAVDPAGDFLIAWEDYRNGQADIYVSLFNGAGTSIGSDLVIIPPPHNAQPQYAPEVVYSALDGFAIGWIDLRNGQEVYIQQFQSLSGLVGSNKLVSEGDIQTINWNIDLVVNKDENLIAHWAAFNFQNNIVRQNFSDGFALSGEPFMVNQSSVGQRWSPNAFVVSSGQLLLGWTEFIGEQSDILIDLFDTSGLSVLLDRKKVNDDAVGAVSSNPQVVSLKNSMSWFVFVDERNDAGDIYCRTASNFGGFHNEDIRVNQDIGSNLQSEPAAAYSGGYATSMVVWVDSRDITGIPGQRIFGRQADLLGEFTDDEFIISDSFQAEVKTSPQIAMNRLGFTIVTWLDNRSGSKQVYGRVLDLTGNFLTSEFLISDPNNDNQIVSQYVYIDNAQNIYVTYLDKSASEPTVMFKVLDIDGVEQDSFEWTSSVLNNSIDQLDVSFGYDGDIYLLWTSLEQIGNLYLTILDRSGSVVTAPFLVSDNSSTNVSDPSIAASGNIYISCCWVDQRNGKKEIYYQMFDDLLQKIDVNLPVSNNPVEYMITPQTITNGDGMAWFVWADPRENGQNIIANKNQSLPLDVKDITGEILPEEFSLSQNYPNPFNPSTVIGFSLVTKSSVSITIFNVVGQQVKQLVNSELPAGNYTVDWDGTNNSGKTVAGGLYFYRMETDSFTETKKMLLLK